MSLQQEAPLHCAHPTQAFGDLLNHCSKLSRSYSDLALEFGKEGSWTRLESLTKSFEWLSANPPLEGTGKTIALCPSLSTQPY